MEMKYISPDNVFKSTEISKMADKISEALSETSTMRQLIDQQRLLAGDVSIDQYKEVIEDLKGE